MISFTLVLQFSVHPLPEWVLQRLVPVGWETKGQGSMKASVLRERTGTQGTEPLVFAWFLEADNCLVGNVMLLVWRLGFQEAGCQETGHLGGWASRRLGVQKAGHPGDWTSKRLGVQEAGCPGYWAPGSWTSRRLGTRRLDIQEAGHPGNWTSRRLGTRKLDIRLLILMETAFVLLSALGIVFLEWAWAEEAQSHLPAVRWTTTHCPQKPAMNVRSMATPNEAGNGEAQTKRTPRTSR